MTSLWEDDAMDTNGSKKLGVLSLGRKRSGFDAEWGRKVEKRVINFLKDSAYELSVVERVIDNASLQNAVTRCREADCTVLIALQPTMSDGRLAPLLAQQWDDTIILWATPERPEGERVSSCSLVGTHIFASSLRQLFHPFELVYGDPTEVRVRRELDKAIKVADALRLVNNAKVGLIGYHAPGFIDIHADPFSMNSVLSTQLYHIGLQDLIDYAQSLPKEAVRADVEQVLKMRVPFEDVTEEDLPTNSRLYLAIKDIAEGEKLDALAVQEWPELPNIMGQWAYWAMLRLSMEGCHVAMEGDVDGAISCLIGQKLGMGSGYLSDWLEHDSETITLWHMGNAPLDMSEPVGSRYGPRLAKHFNIPKPLVVNADLAVDRPITVFRLWRCDGGYRLASLQGETISPRRRLSGTNALAKIHGANVYEWFDKLCHAGMPHHVAVFEGHHKDLLKRFARQLNIDWVE